jgi:Ni/Co efflux regulator RcnB
MALTKFALAAAITLFAINGASATPSVTTKPAASSSEIIQVQHRRHAAPQHRGHRHHYVPGRRYSTAPRGWHRHARRPGDWRTKGCVMVGPLWFCP